MSATPQNALPSFDSVAPWKHGKAPVIGLIGAIGGGKSEVARLLEKRGAVVFDADKIGHAVLEEADARAQVLAEFGFGIVSPQNGASESRVDRKRLAEIVFANPSALKRLEAILHPRMKQLMRQRIDLVQTEDPCSMIVLDAAVLFEANWQDVCDKIVFVDAPASSRLIRVSKQRGWTKETLESREAAQWPLERKRQLADVTIMNDADLAHLEFQVDQFLHHLGLGQEATLIL